MFTNLTHESQLQPSSSSQGTFYVSADDSNDLQKSDEFLASID